MVWPFSRIDSANYPQQESCDDHSLPTLYRFKKVTVIAGVATDSMTPRSTTCHEVSPRSKNRLIFESTSIATRVARMSARPSSFIFLDTVVPVYLLHGELCYFSDMLKKVNS